jgi:hypothetical protein
MRRDNLPQPPALHLISLAGVWPSMTEVAPPARNTMMRSMCTLLLLVVLTSSMEAQSKPAQAQASGQSLAPVAWLVGGTWVSDVKDPSNGAITHVENRIRWAPNEQAIEFNTNFNGKPHYNGFYAYNPAAQSIGFYYTSSEGELTIGTASSDPEGKRLDQDFDVTHADGKTAHLRSTLERDGKDAYWFSVMMQKNGEWAQVFRIRYERTPE